MARLTRKREIEKKRLHVFLLFCCFLVALWFFFHREIKKYGNNNSNNNNNEKRRPVQNTPKWLLSGIMVQRNYFTFDFNKNVCVIFVVVDDAMAWLLLILYTFFPLSLFTHMNFDVVIESVFVCWMLVCAAVCGGSVCVFFLLVDSVFFSLQM